ncbi:hypothetical protein M406DRAFT_339962 [Cryphonectria parasitica EP155]|uniref:DUF1479-domain-containing protein n=1 Tax=Cryphonectria parasitica (strain ATCC 38755 / EP155) TaxID=660469 RepID=A0A9P4Y0K2_CRYP1|nr:uncharacterized protein M406DRAFT_339962 [Cryphonectria parasitica EP155]KAF3764336.1 hypothetical protein M406DRAFT_339962 [Cryphonectria parasitica EP155]
MGASATPTAENITLAEFQKALGRYEQMIDAVSVSKGAKPGQKTLAELDRYRYVEAPKLFSLAKPTQTMRLDHVKTLVEWKLKHGTFRPTLLKLVSSNDESFVEDTVKSAVGSYLQKKDASAAVGILTNLKGIGPATASLLLAIYDPEKVIFFADEAFYWLCCNGSRSPIKYNAKEYKQLDQSSHDLVGRLHVKAVDVERVAYVLMNESDSSPRTEEPALVKKKVAKTDSAAPAKRKQDTVVDGAPAPHEVLSLPGMLAKIKEDLLLGNEAALTRSWERLLHQLREEVKIVTEGGPKGNIPTIEFEDLSIPTRAEPFLESLKTEGAAVIHHIVSEDEAGTWTESLDEYLRYNPHTKVSPPEHPEVYELFWSLAQLSARAHPNMLAAQKILMGHCWKHTAASGSTAASTNHPVVYADQLRFICDCCSGPPPAETSLSTISAQVDGGSVERWEEDGSHGHPKTRTYHKIWSGEWEDYDPWDTSARLAATSNRSSHSEFAGNVFKMFHGMLALNPTEIPPMRFCTLPLKLVTAYWLLRPFFSPKRPLSGVKGQNTEVFLSPSNWALDILQSPVIHGAHPSHTQEINTILHPHLQLDKTLTPLPRLKPGDLVIWHPDTIHADVPSPSCTHTPVPQSPCSPQQDATDAAPPPLSPSTFLYIPTCPLTRTNAHFLARQRKAFVLGLPGPDFAPPPHLRGQDGGDDSIGETNHMGRPGVQEVYEAGGHAALRAMGLLAWDEDGVAEEKEGERELLAMANGILFPREGGNFR